MGYYDKLYCNKKLPDGYEGKFFQTKSLECKFQEYQLIDGYLYGPFGNTNYTGALKFYAKDHMGNWREYDAEFSNGKLTKIEATHR